MAWPAVKKGFTQEGFRAYVAGVSWPRWRPGMIVWHNTAAPSLSQWRDTAAKDTAQGRVPGQTRIENLERYFRNDNGWSGCPHLFIADDLIWVMNPLDAPGVHSPSWNSVSFGIEMVGDYAREDADEGYGLQVKLNTIYATAVLCEAVGIIPTSGEVDTQSQHTRGTIFLHKQDPRTTHDCPGEDMARDKSEMIQAVSDLMAGGDHNAVETAKVISAGYVHRPVPDRQGKVMVNRLNFREGPGATSPARGQLNAGTPVAILGEAANGSTKWLRVRTPAGHIGWVAGKYVNEGVGA